MNTPMNLLRAFLIATALYAALSLGALNADLQGHWEATLSSGPVNLHIALQLGDEHPQ